MGTSGINITEVEKVWPIVSEFVAVPHTNDQYENAVKMLDELIDKIGETENHPLASLMETLGALIECYETRHLPEPASDSIGVLKFLMDEHGIKQSDLSEIGSQGVVSEILNGKRELNVRQIKTLSRRFNVSPAVFF
ncbi:MAG: helix-turn-helix domain-containing protein [Candidatus Aminicenantes bacterium]|jgi:HTH-type transcriptional regulator/antitoxin HigA